MKIAVEGCCHGELDKIYETVAHLEKEQDTKVDLLLICGDFQAVRNRSDFHGLAVPPKFQKLNTFYKYYSGEKVAPVLTVFIGGNHEASNYLQELPYGGWAAPNIYYMGYGGIIQFSGVRIGGLSGIFKGRDYNKGHFERLPYDDNTKRSVYHVRNLEVFRLKQLQEPVDIFLSHDWPLGVYNCGNVNQLLRFKPFFRDDIEAGKLGSPPAAELLRKLQPTYWFSAHLHCKFAAVVQHQNPGGEPKQTNFLALDKCLPRRRFLQIFDIPARNDQLELSLDPEWLAILKSTNHLLNLRATTTFMPGPGSSERFDFAVTPEERNILHDDFGGEFAIPHNFEKTAPAHEATPDGRNTRAPAPEPEMQVNPQTTLLCEMLGITDPTSVFLGKKADLGFDMSSVKEQNPDEINVGDGEDSDDVTDDVVEGDEHAWQGPIPAQGSSTSNPDQISLDSDEDEMAGNVDKNGGNSEALEKDTTPPGKSPLKLPPPNLSGGLSLPKPVNSAPEVTSVKTTENPQSDQTVPESVETVKTDIVQSQEDTSVPPVKKFKRRNQSVYETTEGE